LLSIALTKEQRGQLRIDGFFWNKFIQIKKNKTKRSSPYLETELRDRNELFCMSKYELSKRNKAALALFWDLNARNHEIALLKIKHVSGSVETSPS